MQALTASLQPNLPSTATRTGRQASTRLPWRGCHAKVIAMCQKTELNVHREASQISHPGRIIILCLQTRPLNI